MDLRTLALMLAQGQIANGANGSGIPMPPPVMNASGVPPFIQQGEVGVPTPPEVAAAPTSAPVMPPTTPPGKVWNNMGDGFGEWIDAPASGAAVPAKPFDMNRLNAVAAMLGNADGSSLTLGPGASPIAAPQLSQADYSKADQAWANAKPATISAPQYVQPNYAASDKLWADAKPQGITEDMQSNDMWGKVLTGLFQGLTSNTGLKKGWSAILGGLAGYGSSLENRTKMGLDQANRMSDFLMKQAGYETGKADNTANVQNKTLDAKFDADSLNNTNMTNFYRGLGGFESGKAKDIADTINTQKGMQFQADSKNADLNAVNVLGQNNGQIVFTTRDKNGNLVANVKPLGDFKGVNGSAQGKAGNGAQSGLETLINYFRSAGALRQILTPEVYDKLSAPAKDYAPEGAQGWLTSQGEKGKQEALTRGIAEENAAIANYLMSNPDILDNMLKAIGK